ncbi:MAG: hypothetical protein AAFQ98_07425, partial [Bacteroidota bacterium]
GLNSFYAQVSKRAGLNSILDVGIVTYGAGANTALWPQRLPRLNSPNLETGGYDGPEVGIPSALSLLRSTTSQHTPWLITLCGPQGPQRLQYKDQMRQLEWSLALAEYHTLTVCMDDYEPTFLPPGEKVFRLRETRFPQFFDWLIEALDFQIQCEDDLPYTTAYSWANLKYLHKR